MARRGHRCIVAGSLLLTIGIALAVGWIFAHKKAINAIVDSRLRHELVVDSVDSHNYNDWVQGIAERNPNFYNYSVWNLTNPEDVLQGGKPIFQSVGPYVYRYIWYNRNATFLDGGNQVQYNLIENYIYQPQMSQGRDPKTDIITNINPAYVGVLNQAGSESNMVIGVALNIINQIVNFFTVGEFSDVLSSMYVPPQLATYQAEVVNLIAQSGQVDAQDYYYSLWANATAVPSYLSNYTNMIIGTPTNIPLTSTQQLFSNNATHSLLDNSADAIMHWLRAYQNETSVEAMYIMTTFVLTPDQLHAVLQWRVNNFIATYVKPYLLSQANSMYPGAAWSDLGWLQFYNASFIPTGFSAVYSQYYAEVWGSNPIEIGMFDPPPLSLDQLKNTFYGPYGVVSNPLNFGSLFQALQSDGPNNWNLTQAQIGYVIAYARDFIGTPIANPLIKGFIDQGNAGLFLTKSVDYWLWTCYDPILVYLVGPSLAGCGLQVNDTVQAPSTIWTGKDDISKLNSYVKWRGQSTIENVWAAPVPVWGYTDSGQFNPRIPDDEHLNVFDENFVRTVNLTHMGKKTIQGIETYMYVMDNTAYEASELYTNTITGFANETVINQAPIFLSNWDLLGVDPRYANVTGMKPDRTAVTTIFVEPVTGSTIYAANKQQINMYMLPNASLWFDTFTGTNYTNVQSDAFYPLVKIWQNSQIGPHDAKRLLDARHELKKVYIGLLWGVIGAGIFIALVGFGVVVRGIQLKRREGYMNI